MDAGLIRGKMKIIEGNLIDVDGREIYPCTITVEEGRIVSIERNENTYDRFIAPGLVDAHVHIESSMVMPRAFSRMVVPRGTVAVVADPHEIANVMGVEGITKMMEDAEGGALKCFWGIPSCVPATPYDSTGATLTADDVEMLARTGRFTHLSEMMNVPGVLQEDEEVMRKLAIARSYHLRVDGHAPGLRGEALSTYIERGVETDHESVALDEAKEKIEKGMRVLIREGSAAKNYEALKSLIATDTERVMFCTDDSHADDLLQEGHIDKLVRRAVADGFDLFDVLRVASVNPVRFYHLDVGLLHEGDAADFIMLDDPKSFRVRSVYIDGEEVYREGMEMGMALPRMEALNYFVHDPIREEDVALEVEGEVPCIEVIPDSLVTGKGAILFGGGKSRFEGDVGRDVLKIVYVNRYRNGRPRVGLIHGMGLKKGALATSIAHDSHNIIAVGTNDTDLTAAINEVIDARGGLALCGGGERYSLPLPIGGIMSDREGEEVAERYLVLGDKLRAWGCPLKAPFMTLSFMSLIVIPSLKIGEKGLFDVDQFKFI